MIFGRHALYNIRNLQQGGAYSYLVKFLSQFSSCFLLLKSRRFILKYLVNRDDYHIYKLCPIADVGNQVNVTPNAMVAGDGISVTMCHSSLSLQDGSNVDS